MLKSPWRLAGVSALVLSLLFSGTGCALLKKKPETTGETAAAATPSPTPSASPSPTPRSMERKTIWQVLTFGLLGKRKSEPPKAQAAIQIGTIKLVNETERFVLIDTVAYQAATPGDKLVSINDGKESGTLKVSPLRNPPFLIADIVEGSPSRGDRVYKEGEPAGTH